MRFKIPWSETATLGALYTAVASWSAHGGISVPGAVVLALAFATILLPRPLTRTTTPSGLDSEAILASAAAAGVALASHAAGPNSATRTLGLIANACAIVAAGGALLAALIIADDSRSRLRAVITALVAMFALSLSRAGIRTFPSWFSLSTHAVPAIIAGIIVVRYLASADPMIRARLLVPSVATVLGAGWIGVGESITWEYPRAALMVVGIGTTVFWNGLAFGSAGRWLPYRGTIARFLIATSIACAAGSAVGSLTGNPVVSAFVGATLGTLSIPFLASTLFQPDGGRLLYACERASRAVLGAETFEDIASAVLEPIRIASRDLRAPAEFWVLANETRITLDVSGAAYTGKLSPQLERALLSWLRGRPGEVVFGDAIRPLEVRRPELRPLISLLEEHEAFAALPLLDSGDLTAVVLIPRGRRTANPSLSEQLALLELAQSVSGAVRACLALDRAKVRTQEANALATASDESRRAAERERDQANARARGSRAVRAIGSLENAWIGYSESMRLLETKLRSYAPQSNPLTLVAEPGAAISAVAKLLHELSPRSLEPCVLLDAAEIHPRDALLTLVGSNAISDSEDPSNATLEQSGWLELVGGGTLVILDLPALGYDAHVALSEALKTGFSNRLGGGEPYAVRARLVVTSRGASLGSGLPAELCQRLEEHTVYIPSLRERAEDLETLVLFGIDRACRVLARPPLGIRRDTLGVLKNYPWPGNESELYEVLEYAVRQARGPQLLLEDLPSYVRAGPKGAGEGGSPRASVPPPDGSRDGEGESYDALERRILQSALDRASGNKSEAARALGMARTTFLDKLRKYGLRA